MTAIDQDVRDRVIRQIGTSVALSAGAGSGKTSVLTERVLALLAQGTAPARIAAITFTEKAAGELESRVRDALERRLAEAPTPALEQAVRQLPELVVSTIHAFCRRLLTAEALESGWAPDTEVMPRVFEAPTVAAAFSTWEDGFRERHPAAALVARQVVPRETLKKSAVRLLGFRDLAVATDPRPYDPDRARDELGEVIARIEAAAELCTAPDEDKLLANNALLRATLRRAADPAAVLASGVTPSKSGGRASDWADGGKQRFLDALAAFVEWRERHLARLHGVVARDLHEHFLPLVEAAKASAAVADYDDLLFRAAELLGDDAVRARLADRFDAVLVDEVQDTDPIQAEVAALLCRASELAGAWNEHPPRAGKLFAVGDPRQSIYRFRRADVETWGELQALIGRDGETPSLVQNFRSVPGIVEWVNHTFADLEGYVPQHAARPPAELEPVVRLVTEDDDELEMVTRHLLALHARGTRWSDVMVLLPSWSRSEAVAGALRSAGIPCLVEGGAAFRGRDEVRLAMAALKCLDEPADERSTLLVLRGLFGLDWDALACHRAAGGAWRYALPDPPPGPVGEAFGMRRELSRQRGRASWVAILDELLDRTRAASVWAAHREGEQRLVNLDKLRALLRQAESVARSPSEVLEIVDGLDDEKDLSRVDYDSDAVRVTSYFKAKGLEAQVVVLCCASRRRDGVDVVVDRKRRTVALRIGELKPPDWEERVEQERLAVEAERRRWMYVAATRARDQLVLVDHEGSELVRTHLANGLGRAPEVDLASLPAATVRTETFPGFDVGENGPDPTEAWALATRDAVREARSASTRWRSVQEVATRERVAHAASPVGVIGGVLVHDVMEALDLGAPLDEQLAALEGLVATSAASLEVPSEVAVRCLEILRGMLRDPVLERARQAPERWVEVPFSIQDGGRVVSGRMDLAFPTDNSRRRWVVVDWKSDLPRRDTPAWRNYQRQLAIYAKALLKTVSPCEEVETVLVGPYPELGEADADWIAEVHEELRPALQELVDRGVPRPLVGCDVGDPIVAQAELAWEEQRLALCVGQPADTVAALRAQGWTVIEADPSGLTWAADAMAALGNRLDGTNPAR